MEGILYLFRFLLSLAAPNCLCVLGRVNWLVIMERHLLWLSFFRRVKNLVKVFKKTNKICTVQCQWVYSVQVNWFYKQMLKLFNCSLLLYKCFKVCYMLHYKFCWNFTDCWPFEKLISKGLNVEQWANQFYFPVDCTLSAILNVNFFYKWNTWISHQSLEDYQN